MDSLINMVKRLQTALDIDVDKLVDDITKENKEQLIDTNTEEQLYRKGQLANGEYLPEYSETTKFLKRSGNGDTRTQNMTLKDEGDFYNAFDLKVVNDGYLIYSGDWKTPDLVRRYGKDIFGLTDENLQEHINKLYKPEIIKAFEDALSQAKK